MAIRALVEPGPPLTPVQVERYSRHLLLDHVGQIGQRRLRRARVCVVGAGGLGAPVLAYLAAAGVGRLGIVDFDVVEVSNLQRQVLHGVADVGRAKVDSARESVLAIDPDLDVVVHAVRLSAENVDVVLRGYDLVIDGTDTFETRYLVNDACVRLGLPEVWGSVLRFDAQVSVFWGSPPEGSGVDPVELRDLFPAPPAPGSVPSCAQAGVLGALCGQVGSLMATEAIKLVTGIGDPLLGRVLVLDALAARWSEVPLRGGSARSRPPAVPDVAVVAPATITPRELARLLAHRGEEPGAAGATGGPDAFVLIDVREPAERAIVSIAGSRLVPLGAILDGSALADLPLDRPIVLHCRSGLRSERAARALESAGFEHVTHLAGGILAWIDEIDPTLPRY